MFDTNGLIHDFYDHIEKEAIKLEGTPLKPHQMYVLCLASRLIVDF